MLGKPPQGSAKITHMAKIDEKAVSIATNDKEADDLRPEYDFKDGVRGKYFDLYRKSCGTVRLDPDVAQAFPTDQEVNQALRMVIKLTEIREQLLSTSGKCSSRREARHVRPRREGRKRARTA